MSAPGSPQWRTPRRQPQRLRGALAELRADVFGDLERTVIVASMTCESCGLRPSTAAVVLPDAPPFAVCGNCTPNLARRSPLLPPMDGPSVLDAEVWTARPGRLTVVRDAMPAELPTTPVSGEQFEPVAGAAAAPGERRPRWEGDVPPMGWSGTIRLPMSWADVLTSVGLLAAVAVSCLATYWFGGRDQGAFVHMVLVGVAGFLVTATVDAWLLGRRDRRRLQRILADNQLAALSPFRKGGHPDTSE